ncbi:hypothetical protein BC629DRAFT_73014 [Irpex lacteus]|nr:hypothetical protein BC629DRAFT_73014 [Irpex lacteus]
MLAGIPMQRVAVFRAFKLTLLVLTRSKVTRRGEVSDRCCQCWPSAQLITLARQKKESPMASSASHKQLVPMAEYTAVQQATNTDYANRHTSTTREVQLNIGVMTSKCDSHTGVFCHASVPNLQPHAQITYTLNMNSLRCCISETTGICTAAEVLVAQS